ncbi:MAG: hypothetical protein AAF570_03255 [Bacteroidota bacterium]
MSAYPVFAQELAQYLVDAINGESSDSPASARSDDVRDLLTTMVQGIPYYGDPDVASAQYTALATQMALTFPNNSISAHPKESGAGFSCRYEYIGSYSGYRDAFFGGVASTPTQARMRDLVVAADGKYTNDWWGKYGVAVLTDAIQEKVSVSISSSRLSDDLESHHQQFKQGISPSYQATIERGFSPTANPFQSIEQMNALAEAAQMLNDGISANNFRTNFNAFILSAGDSVYAAEWFQYNLWIALKALRYPDVDAAIAEHIDEGLIVHTALEPANWWVGEYRSWFYKIPNTYLPDPCWSRIWDEMPQEAYVHNTFPYPSDTHAHSPADEGYSHSLCEWGALSYYD